MVPSAVVLSLAQPLRELEEHVYRLLGLPPPSITGTQDGLLLQELRAILFERNPWILTQAFQRAVENCSDRPLVVNDDCRLGSKEALDVLAFTYVWVEGEHSQRRSDAKPAQSTSSSHDAVIPSAWCNYRLINTGTIGELTDQVAQLLEAMELIR
jgi:hypothetical protein